jgi:micrococcal nuclease
VKKSAKTFNFSVTKLLIPFSFILLLFSNFYFWQKSQKLEQEFVVKEVFDGDSFSLRTDISIRLSNVEAPELNFCGGKQAKKALEDLVLGKPVKYEIVSKDQFQRLIALVWVNGTFVNEELLKDGWARYDGSPSPKRDELKKAFDEAYEAHRGIFSPLCLSEKPEDPKCLIKGNISRHGKNQKTYHFPGCSAYEEVMVEKDLGENWFCTEAEAQKAGYKKSENCFGRNFKP